MREERRNREQDVPSEEFTASDENLRKFNNGYYRKPMQAFFASRGVNEANIN